MKVQNVNQNYGNYANLQYQSRGANPNFTGGASSVKPFIQYLPDYKTIEKMNKFKWLKGELGGILITAVGTGLVAPIFIAFNPFVKADKNATPEQKKDVAHTKEYTAMRQPISACLAALFQAGALGPIDRFIENSANNPETAKLWSITLDQSALNKRSYIERQIKKKMKKDNESFSDKNAFMDELTKRANSVEYHQIKKVSKKFMENGQIIIGKRAVGRDTVIDLVNEKINDYIKDAEGLITSDDGLKFYKKRADVLINNEKEIRKVFGNIPKNNEELAAYLKKALDETENPDIKELIQEVLDHKESVRASRCQRTLSRIDKIKEACGGKYSSEVYMQKMIDKNHALTDIVHEDGIIDRLKKCIIKNKENVSEKDILSTIEDVAKICHFEKGKNSVLDGSPSFSSGNVELLKNKISEDIIKAYKSLTEKKFKGFSQCLKVGIGVFITLPITCTALNWIYPRFMELFFPKLAGVKKDKAEAAQKNGGDK